MSWNAEKREFTREDFYKLVWRKPTTTIAEELGCSDSWIKKICRKHGIPKPGVGYWAKVQHGQKPRKTQLPKCRNADLQKIYFTIESEKPKLNEPKKVTEMEEFDADILELLEKARRLKPIEVKTTLRNPHPLVKDTLKAHKEAAKKKKKKNLQFTDPYIPPKILNTILSPDTSNRAMRIMDALLKRIEKLKGEIQIQKGDRDDWDTVVTFTGETAGELRIREKYRQTRRPLTKEESKNILYFGKKVMIESVATGKLILDSGGLLSSYCHAKDTEKHTLESKLSKVVEDLISSVGRSRIWRRKKEAERIARQREEARREEIRKQQRLENERIEKLLGKADNWEKSKRIRDYLAAFREFVVARDGDFPETGPDAEYYTWALDQADRFDPFKSSPNSILDEKFEEDWKWSPIKERMV